MASKKTKNKNRNQKKGPTGFATDRDRINRWGRVTAIVLIVVMVVFMLLSSSTFLFN